MRSISPGSSLENFFASTFVEILLLISNESFTIAGLLLQEEMNEELPAL